MSPRDFRPEAPNRVWAADIKQIRTAEGWLYLAAVQDLFSRRIVGWAMDRHMRQELVVDALQMAVAARRPAKGTIHHSDHGGQPEFNRSSQQRVREINLPSVDRGVLGCYRSDLSVVTRLSSRRLARGRAGAAIAARACP